MNNKEIILDVKNLNTSFVSDRKEVKIVKNVSFQLKRGHALAVVGVNAQKLSTVSTFSPTETSRADTSAR